MSHKPKGIAARAGRWSAQHRKTAIFGWLAFVIVAFVIGHGTGTKKVEQTLPGESGRAQTIQEENFPHAKKTAAEEDTGPVDAFAGGFPVPPMPAGGAVRGAAAPLTFDTGTTVRDERDTHG